MKFTSTLLLASGIVSGVSAKVTTHFAGCKYTTIGAYNNCLNINGGVSPCGSDSDCFVACNRAGSNDKSGDFRMVVDDNGVGNNPRCECRCYRNVERFG